MWGSESWTHLDDKRDWCLHLGSLVVLGVLQGVMVLFSEEQTVSLIKNPNIICQMVKISICNILTFQINGSTI